MRIPYFGYGASCKKARSDPGLKCNWQWQVAGNQRSGRGVELERQVVNQPGIAGKGRH